MESVRDVGVDEKFRHHALLEHEFSYGYERLRRDSLPRICNSNIVQRGRIEMGHFGSNKHGEHVLPSFFFRPRRI